MYKQNKLPEYSTRLRDYNRIPDTYSMIPGRKDYSLYNSAPGLEYKSTINHVKMYV